jgi:hypothetical protein
MSRSFDDWSKSWEEPQKYEGRQIPDAQIAGRIQKVLSAWNKPLPSNWNRRDWSYIKSPGYRRGDKDRRPKSEPKSEHDLEMMLFAANLDGRRTTWPVMGLGEEVTFDPVLNAVSLANQNPKQREVDVLGILTFPHNRILCSVEMKGASTNSAWFAVVENLQHLKLIQNYPQESRPSEGPFEDLRNLAWSETWGMVLAPPPFFNSRGQKENSFTDAKRLVRSINQELGLTILLACFHCELGKSIEVLFRPD